MFQLARQAKKLISVELSTGQMIDDVKLAAHTDDIAFFGRQGGIVPTPTEILNQVRASFNKPPVFSHYSKKIDSARTEASR